ncbi:MAG: hypothetical protein QXK51_08785 [Candidatus Methanomethylicia archaeon]
MLGAASTVIGGTLATALYKLFVATEKAPITVYPPKLNRANFIKLYSPSNLEILAELEFDKRSAVTEANLSFNEPEKIDFPLKEKEKNVYEGRISLKKPKPVDYLAVWDAKTKEGKVASKEISESERTLVMTMPLGKEEYYSFEDTSILDELFESSISIHWQDPENVFLQSYKILKESEKKVKRKESLQALTYYSLGILSGLPYNKQNVSLLLDISEKKPFDFDPIWIVDQKYQTHLIESKNIARDTWLHAELAPSYTGKDELYEALDLILQEVYYSLFDHPYGPSYYDKKTYSPNDESIHSEIIEPFIKYLIELTEKNETPFSLYSSDLNKNISDRINRQFALRYLGSLLPIAYDKEFGKRYLEEYRARVGEGVYPPDFKEKSVRKGIEGIKLFVEQLPGEYEEIKKILNPALSENAEARFIFYEWLIDRGGSGLAYTVNQFIGDWEALKKAYYDQVPFPPPPVPCHQMLKKIEDAIRDKKGIHQFLSKNWKPWSDLVEVIVGYNQIRYGEQLLFLLGMEQSMKAFGIPWSPSGDFSASGWGWEWGVYGIPDSVVNHLKSGAYGRVVVGYGNGFGLLFCVDGVEKDGSRFVRVYQMFRGPLIESFEGAGTKKGKIYLW